MGCTLHLWFLYPLPHSPLYFCNQILGEGSWVIDSSGELGCPEELAEALGQWWGRVGGSQDVWQGEAHHSMLLTRERGQTGRRRRGGTVAGEVKTCPTEEQPLSIHIYVTYVFLISIPFPQKIEVAYHKSNTYIYH